MKIYMTHRTQCPAAVAAEELRVSTQTLGWSTWERDSRFTTEMQDSLVTPGTGPKQGRYQLFQLRTLSAEA